MSQLGQSVEGETALRLNWTRQLNHRTARLPGDRRDQSLRRGQPRNQPAQYIVDSTVLMLFETADGISSLHIVGKALLREAVCLP